MIPAWGNFLNGVSEFVFAATALFVAARSMRGYLLESQAEKAATVEQKQILLERARTLYALTAFQSAPVLVSIALAALGKLTYLGLQILYA